MNIILTFAGIFLFIPILPHANAAASAGASSEADVKRVINSSERCGQLLPADEADAKETEQVKWQRLNPYEMVEKAIEFYKNKYGARFRSRFLNVRSPVAQEIMRDLQGLTEFNKYFIIAGLIRAACHIDPDVMQKRQQKPWPIGLGFGMILEDYGYSLDRLSAYDRSVINAFCGIHEDQAQLANILFLGLSLNVQFELGDVLPNLPVVLHPMIAEYAIPLGIDIGEVKKRFSFLRPQDQEAFSEKSCDEIWLRHKCVNTIDALSSSRSVQRIDLSSNIITDIPDDLAVRFPCLVSINLDQNPLSPEAQERYKKLKAELAKRKIGES